MWLALCQDKTSRALSVTLAPSTMPLRSPENISLHGRTVAFPSTADRSRMLFRSRAIRSGNAYTYAKTYTNSEVTPYSSTAVVPLTQ